MRRSNAKQLAEKVTNRELKEMFYNAQREIKDWGKVSKINKSMSIGSAFNILSAGVDSDDFVTKNLYPIVKFNMVREFGEYLPDYQPEQTPIKSNIKITHNEPRFLK